MSFDPPLPGPAWNSNRDGLLKLARVGEATRSAEPQRPSLSSCRPRPQSDEMSALPLAVSLSFLKFTFSFQTLSIWKKTTGCRYRHYVLPSPWIDIPRSVRARVVARYTGSLHSALSPCAVPSLLSASLPSLHRSSIRRLLPRQACRPAFPSPGWRDGYRRRRAMLSCSFVW